MVIMHEDAAPLYNQHIDKHLCGFISENLNLSSLFESEILFHQLSTFNNMSASDEKLLIPSDCTSLRQVLDQRDEGAIKNAIGIA